MADSEPRVVLVCLGNRNHEVRFSQQGTCSDLEQAIRRTFDDLGSLKPSSSLILQVSVY